MAEPPRDDDKVLRLSTDEALVLFELLSRWMTDKAKPAPPADCFESRSECAVLSALLADLEPLMNEPFQRDYAELLEAARARLLPRWDADSLRV